MSLHYAKTEKLADGYRAKCQCGWQGPVRYAEKTAENDGLRHELRERGPGPYA